MNTRHIILHRALFFNFIFTAILCFQTMHAQVEEVSRGLGSRGPVLAFASVGRGDTVFAATGSGQLFRSADTGRSWTLIRSVPADQAICSLLGSGNELIAGCRNGAVLKSSDAGDTWTHAYSFSVQSTVTAITQDDHGVLALSKQGGIAFRGHDEQQWDSIATAPSIYCIDIMRPADSVLLVGSHGEGIFISHDEGRSWRGPKECPLSAMISDLERCPCGGILASTSDLSLYHSSDAGECWELYDGASCSGPKGRYQDIAIWNDSLIFAADITYVKFWDGHGRAYSAGFTIKRPIRSIFCLMDDNILIGDTLGGIHRTQVPPVATTPTDYVFLHDTDIHPVLAPGEHFAFSVSVKRRSGRIDKFVPGIVHSKNTLSGEEAIVQLDSLYNRNPPFIVTVPPGAAEGEYAIVFRLVEGQNAGDIEFRQRFSVRHIAMSQRIQEVYRAESEYGFELLHGTESGEIYCRDGDGILMQSCNMGATWRNILPQAYADKSIRTVTGSTQTALFAVTYDDQLLVSRDGGTSWEEEATFGSEVKDITSAAEHILTNVDGHIYLSHDTGRSWKRITPFFDNLYFGMQIIEKGDILLSCMQGLVHSDDDGMNWRTLRTPDNKKRITDFLLRADGNLLIPSGFAMHWSTDMGKSWCYDIDRELRLGYLRQLLETGDGTLYAKYLTGNPIVRYNSSNARWENDPAVPDTLQNDISEIRGVGNTIAIATRYKRLYIRPADGITTVRQPQQPRGFRITSASPNPSFGTTRIMVENEMEQTLQLQVYDMLGRCRATLHDGQLRAGRSMFRLQASALPAGSYLVVLRNGTSVHARKITLMH